MFLQRDPNASKRATGTNRARKAVNAPVCLAPDFLACSFDMSLSVREVVELILKSQGRWDELVRRYVDSAAAR